MPHAAVQPFRLLCDAIRHCFSGVRSSGTGCFGLPDSAGSLRQKRRSLRRCPDFIRRIDHILHPPSDPTFFLSESPAQNTPGTVAEKHRCHPEQSRGVKQAAGHQQQTAQRCRKQSAQQQARQKTLFFFQNAASALPQKPPTQTDTVASGHAIDAEQPCFAIQAADPKMQSVAANTPASAPSSRAAGV